MLNSSHLLAGVRAAVAACVLVAAPLVSTNAHAALADCGNINIEADATCEVEVEGGCVAHCTPVSVEAACAGECTTQCDKLPSIDCTASCEADCSGGCTADPGSFECEGSCTADCDGTCAAKCSSDADSSQCQASCKATCTAECRGSCQGTAPSASCDVKCKAKCQGQCKADLNMDCDTKCHGDCTVEATGGCKAKCTEPDGAIFCDGEYVDDGGHAQKCIDSIEAYIKAHVDVSARGSASCEGNTCTAEGEASCKCAVPGRSVDVGSAGYAALGCAIFGAAAVARRKRR